MSEQTLLRGGTHTHIEKIGQTVHRPHGPHSTFTKRVLDLLAASTVVAPRYLGVDEVGRDVLSFIEGDVRHEHVHIDDGQLVLATTLVRKMHDATAGSALAGAAEVVCHNDLAPWNLVWRDGEPIAFIDFDAAAPGARVDDLAYFAWTTLELGGVTSVAEQARRLRLVCATYDVRASADVIDAIARQQRRILLFREHEAAASPDASRRAFSSLRAQRIRTEMAWLAANRATLERPIGP